jgi:hypothetical protein
VLRGESAGAHLAALAGLGAPAGQDAPADAPGPAIAGVVDWSGPADLASMGDPADPHPREAPLVGGPVRTGGAGIRHLNPSHPGAGGVSSLSQGGYR